jgi:hypothetical protein
MHWIYLPQNQAGNFAVGYYLPDGTFVLVSTQDTEDAAQALVSYLNGGSAPS